MLGDLSIQTQGVGNSKKLSIYTVNIIFNTLVIFLNWVNKESYQLTWSGFNLIGF